MFTRYVTVTKILQIGEIISWGRGDCPRFAAACTCEGAMGDFNEFAYTD